MTGFWVPSEAEVLEAEKRLEEFLANEGPLEVSEKANNYSRQYVGILINEKKALYINAFFVPGRTVPNWRTQYIVVCDGGPNAWGDIPQWDRKIYCSLIGNRAVLLSNIGKSLSTVPGEAR